MAGHMPDTCLLRVSRGSDQYPRSARALIAGAAGQLAAAGGASQWATSRGAPGGGARSGLKMCGWPSGDVVFLCSVEGVY